MKTSMIHWTGSEHLSASIYKCTVLYFIYQLQKVTSDPVRQGNEIIIIILKLRKAYLRSSIVTCWCLRAARNRGQRRRELEETRHARRPDGQKSLRDEHSAEHLRSERVMHLSAALDLCVMYVCVCVCVCVCVGGWLRWDSLWEYFKNLKKSLWLLPEV